MSVTREEALAYALRKKAGLESEINKSNCEYGKWVTYSAELDFTNACISALKGPTGEHVEKMRGEWIIEDAGDGDLRKKCSLCNQPISGWWGRDRFCANCGAPMTDEAVDMVMERLEEVQND